MVCTVLCPFFCPRFRVSIMFLHNRSFFFNWFETFYCINIPHLVSILLLIDICVLSRFELF